MMIDTPTFMNIYMRSQGPIYKRAYPIDTYRLRRHNISMDSLEARLQFITVLKNLQKTLNIVDINTTNNNTSRSNRSSSTNSSSSEPSGLNDPIQFYLNNYEEHYEDFHQCIFDTIKKYTVLNRLPILIYYFKVITRLNNLNNDTSTTVLNDFFIPSIVTLFELVLPKDDIIALTNLNVCQTIANELIQLQINMPSHSTIYQQLTDLMENRSVLQESYFNNYQSESSLTSLKQDNTVSVPDTTAILNRMELDRERHKKLKEQNWKVTRTYATDIDNTTADLQQAKATKSIFLTENEFKSQWEKLPPLDDFDRTQMRELNKIARESYMM